MVWLQTAVLALAATGSGEPVLLDFYADWCGPCRQMDPTVEQLIARGYPVRRVNVDREPALARQYGVQGIPCFVMVAEGKEVDRVVGATSFSRLAKMCQAAAPARAKSAAPSRWAKSRAPRAAAPAPLVNVEIPSMPSSGPVFSTSAGQRAAATSQNVVPASHTAPLAADAPSWRLAAPAAKAEVPIAQRLIACTVRLRVEDADGHSCGTGTIIDARQGQALILTCGHIFRDSKGQGRIDVDLFGPRKGERTTGRLLSYDLKRDVALLSIRLAGPIPAARVAPAGYPLAAGNPVYNVGCNNGGDPTVRQSRISSLDKFLGPPNVQVPGTPVEGRSGGGLFSADGQVIGVCNAADPMDREGFYAALASIHAELDRNQLASIHQSSPRAVPAAEASLVAVEPPSMPKQMPPTGTPAPLADAAPPAERNPVDADPSVVAASHQEESSAARSLDLEEVAALSEIRRRRAEGAEVICVVRSRTDPHAKSEIFVLDQVSPAFLEGLAKQVRAQDTRHLTSLEVPRSAQPRVHQRPSTPPPGALWSTKNLEGTSHWQPRR